MSIVTCIGTVEEEMHRRHHEPSPRMSPGTPIAKYMVNATDDWALEETQWRQKLKGTLHGSFAVSSALLSNFSTSSIPAQRL